MITPRISVPELDDAIPGVEIWGRPDGEWLAMFSAPGGRWRSWSAFHSSEGWLDVMGPPLVGAYRLEDTQHLLEVLRALRVITSP
jgi:hypothetical protein